MSSVPASDKSVAPGTSFQPTFSGFNPRTTPQMSSMLGNSSNVTSDYQNHHHERENENDQHHQSQPQSQLDQNNNSHRPSWSAESVSSLQNSPQIHSPRSNPPDPNNHRVPSISGPSGVEAMSTGSPIKQTYHQQQQQQYQNQSAQNKQQPTIRTSLLTSKLAAAAATTSTSNNCLASSSFDDDISNGNSNAINNGSTHSNINHHRRPSFESSTSSSSSRFPSSNSFSSSNPMSSSFPYSHSHSHHHHINHHHHHQNTRGLSGSIRKQSPRTSTGAGAFGTSPFNTSNYFSFSSSLTDQPPSSATSSASMPFSSSNSSSPFTPSSSSFTPSTSFNPSSSSYGSSSRFHNARRLSSSSSLHRLGMQQLPPTFSTAQTSKNLMLSKSAITSTVTSTSSTPTSSLVGGFQNPLQSFMPHPASTTTNVTMAIASGTSGTSLNSEASGTSTPLSQNSFSTAKSFDSRMVEKEEKAEEKKNEKFEKNESGSTTTTTTVGGFTPKENESMDVDESQELFKNESKEQNEKIERDENIEQDEPYEEGDGDVDMGSVTPRHNAHIPEKEKDHVNSSVTEEDDSHTNSTATNRPFSSSSSVPKPSNEELQHESEKEKEQEQEIENNNEQDAKQEQNQTEKKLFEHLDIANHNSSEVIVMLTALLQKIVDANDALHPTHYQTAFAHNKSLSKSSSSSNKTENSKHENKDENDKSKSSYGDIINSKFTANVLAFHGRNVPAIALEAYLHRILKYCPATNEVFISLLVYFDRIAQRANSGELNKKKEEGLGENKGDDESSNNTNFDTASTPETTPDTTSTSDATSTSDTLPSSTELARKQLFVMDSYNIHRLIITGVTVASKFFSDIFYKNTRYAKVGGLPVEELNHLELQFLVLTGFELMIPLEEMQRYADLLVGFWKKENEGKENNEEQEGGKGKEVVDENDQEMVKENDQEVVKEKEMVDMKA